MPRLELIPRIHAATHRIDLYLRDARQQRTSQGEAHVLAHLVEYGDSSLNHLHRAFGHRRSTLTSIVDRLEQAGLVRRKRSQADRRSLLLTLTPRGGRLARGVHRSLAALEANATRRFSAAELEVAAAVLEAFAEVP